MTKYVIIHYHDGKTRVSKQIGDDLVMNGKFFSIKFEGKLQAVYSWENAAVLTTIGEPEPNDGEKAQFIVHCEGSDCPPVLLKSPLVDSDLFDDILEVEFKNGAKVWINLKRLVKLENCDAAKGWQTL
jgi:hypothetical protein